MKRHPSNREQTAQLYNNSGAGDQFLKLAIRAVQLEHEASGNVVEPEDLFIVWFVKVLGNWKALVGQRSSTNYFEVTFNGAGDEVYVDRYVKRTNTKIAGEKLRTNW